MKMRSQKKGREVSKRMTNFFVIKEKVTKFYKDFESYFQIAFKFLVAFFVFGLVNDKLGYYPILGNIGIQVVLSLISAIVPSSVFVLLVAIITLLHLYKLSLVMMLLAFVVFVVFYFLYLKFAPKHGVLMMVIPMLMPFNLHFIVPLIAGLFYSPFTIVPVASSFILMTIVRYIIEAAPMVDSGKLDVEAIVGAYQYVIDHVLENKEMLLFGAVFALIIVLTYVISRFPFDYAWYVGIGLGTVAGIVGLLIGGGMFGVEVSAGGVIVGSIISGLIVAIIQFLHCTVDYSRKEFVQFEDDDYYYYVKAVPKIAVAAPERNVQSFNGRQGTDFKESVKQMFSRDEDEDVFDEDFDDFTPQPVKTAVPSKPAKSSKPEKQAGGSVLDRLKGSKTKAPRKADRFDRRDDEDISGPSGDTQIFEKNDDAFAKPEKQPDIIIPEVKIPARTVPKVEADELQKPATAKTEKKAAAPAKPEKKTAAPAPKRTVSAKPAKTDFDFDFDDDGYDDSMEDYGSDDLDF